VPGAELAAAHVELVGDIVWARELTGGDQGNRWGWFFFRAPGGDMSSYPGAVWTQP
jgi:hypothetical protein